MKNGLYTDLSNEDYHDCDALSTSQIKNMNVMAKAKYAMEHKFEASDAMLLGTVTHALVLEPEKFDEEFILAPVGAPKKPTAAQINAKKKSDTAIASIKFWDSFSAKAEGKTIVSQDVYSKASLMAESVKAHPEAGAYLAEGVPEQSIFWEHEGQQLRCRPDWVNHTTVVDLKTAQDASPLGFAKAIANFRYDLQQAIYEDGCSTQFEVDDFIFIVVESSAPYLTAVYRIKPQYIIKAREKYKGLLDDWKIACDFDTFKGYSDDIIELDLPSWIR